VSARAARLAALAVLTGLLLCGCAQRQLGDHMTNIAGLVEPLRFHMTDQDGRPVSAADYRGEVVLLYFGYTHCLDACPTTLATLADAIARLGAQGQRVRVLFVTVDPRRDTVAVLKRYVNDFGPQFVGLRGTHAQLTRMIKRYRVSYHDEKPDASGAYEVDHSSAVFIFGRHGHARLLAQSGAPAAVLATDLRQLLASA
jgi:protein SCO1/2